MSSYLANLGGGRAECGPDVVFGFGDLKSLKVYIANNNFKKF